MKPTLLVIGGGTVGRLIAETYAPVATVTVVDHLPLEPLDGVEFIHADALNLDLLLIHNNDWICLCLPETAALQALAQMAPALRQEQLLVDTLSAKTCYLHTLQQTGSPVEILSINPLFAPDLGWRGNNLVYVSRNAAENTAKFLAIIESQGVTVTQLHADEHDQAMSSLQCATHVAALAFALSLSESGYKASNTKALWTPPHKMLLSLVARMGELDFEVYRDIQHSNPLAADTRRAFTLAIERIAASSENPNTFADLMEEAQSILGDSSTELKKVFHEFTRIK